MYPALDARRPFRVRASCRGSSTSSLSVYGYRRPEASQKVWFWRAAWGVLELLRVWAWMVVVFPTSEINVPRPD